MNADMILMIHQIFLVATIMLLMDFGWLAANNKFHNRVFAELQGQPLQVRIIPAVLVYILMIVAVWFFAVSPAADWVEAAGRGALIGAVMYGLYDLTNYATLVNYPIEYAISDMMWGTTLCTVVAAAVKWFIPASN
jgi:uncharacterized membrane protein